MGLESSVHFADTIGLKQETKAACISVISGRLRNPMSVMLAIGLKQQTKAACISVSNGRLRNPAPILLKQSG